MKEKDRREQVDPDDLNLITVFVGFMAGGGSNLPDFSLKVLPLLSNVYLPDYPSL